MILDQAGNRKYLTALERRRFIRAAQNQPEAIKNFCLTLVHTGARISEVLNLRLDSIDRAAGVIVIESLKKRRKGVFRQVPVPRHLLLRLTAMPNMTTSGQNKRLWVWSRTTAWKLVKGVMQEAGIPYFCAQPKALRHSFGVIGIAEAKVPLNMMQKWMGHARIETTAIYANAVGAEERAMARRMWR